MNVAPPAPTVPTTSTLKVKFSVKASDPNGGKSKFSAVIGNLGDVLAQLPKTSRGKPTLAGLTNLYLYIGSATFTANVSGSKVTGPFTAKLSAGKSPTVTIQAKGLNLISLLGLVMSTDGESNVPGSLGLIGTSFSINPVTIFSGYNGGPTITYVVAKGTATAK